MAQISDLPQEILDSIIDVLRDDLLALKSCASVARSWRDRSHLHFFHTVEVKGTQLATSFAILLDGSPNIAASIREVSLVRSILMSGFETVPARTLISTLQRLPSLQSLAFLGVSMELDDADEPLYFDYPRLRSLVFKPFYESEAALRTMALFSRVRIDALRAATRTVFPPTKKNKKTRQNRRFSVPRART